MMAVGLCNPWGDHLCVCACVHVVSEELFPLEKTHLRTWGAVERGVAHSVRVVETESKRYARESAELGIFIRSRGDVCFVGCGESSVL